MEKVNPLMDQVGGLHERSFPSGCCAKQRMGSRKAPQNPIGLVPTKLWPINIDFNDIETSNDIDEADDPEATFTLDNMEPWLAMPGRQGRCFPSGNIK